MPFDYRAEQQRYQHYYKNLRRLYQRPVTQVSIFVVMSFMLVAFFSVFAIRPTLVTISQLIREIETKREADQALTKKLADLSRIQAGYGQLQDNLELVLRTVPDEPVVEGLVLGLEVVAAKHQVRLVNLQIDKVSWGKAAGKSQVESDKVKFTVTGGGDLDNLKQWLAAVEKLDRLVVVRQATFTSGTPFLRREGINVTVTVAGEIYFMPRRNNAG